MAPTSMKVVRGVRSPVFSATRKTLRERGVRTVSPLMARPAERVRAILDGSRAARSRWLEGVVRAGSARDAALVPAIRAVAREAMMRQRRAGAAPFAGTLRPEPSLASSPSVEPIKIAPQAGLGAWTTPVHRVHISYCSHQPCSAGPRAFLAARLAVLAAEFPAVHWVVEPRWGRRAVARAFYVPDSRVRTECVAGKTVGEIEAVVRRLLEQSGARPALFRQRVLSDAPAVRPLWSPFYSRPTAKNNPLQSVVQPL